MALFLFTKAILAGEPINVYNEGKMRRDFTYIDDIVEGVVRVTDKIPEPNSQWNSDAPDPGTSLAPYKLYNIGNHSPVELMKFIDIIEEKLGVKAVIKLLPIQPGDVPATFADVEDLKRDVGFAPSTTLEIGIGRFIDWYRGYYNARLEGV